MLNRLKARSEESTLKANRMEAFSDGVLAIIITIMVLEFKVPEDHDWYALIELGQSFLATFSVSYISAFTGTIIIIYYTWFER